jgi:hypothetical protein
VKRPSGRSLASGNGFSSIAHLREPSGVAQQLGPHFGMGPRHGWRDGGHQGNRHQVPPAESLPGRSVGGRSPLHESSAKMIAEKVARAAGWGREAW